MTLNSKTSAIKQQSSKNEYRSSMIRFIIACAAVLAVILAEVFFVNHTGRPLTYTIQNGGLKISTDFGETVPLSDIQSVQLKDSLPGGLIMTNGMGYGSILKGEWKSGNENMNLYVNTSKPPFLYLNTTDGLIILNENSASATKALCGEIKGKIAK